MTSLDGAAGSVLLRRESTFSRSRMTTTTFSSTRKAETTRKADTSGMVMVAPQQTPAPAPLQYAPGRAFVVGGSAAAVAAADMDSDGRQDLVVALFSADSVVVLKGDGAGGFVAGSSVAAGQGPVAVVVLDVTQDGRPDVVVASALSSTITVLANNGNGGFDAVDTVQPGIQPMALTAVDLDADGRMDVAAALGDGRVAVLRTNAGGGLAEAVLVGCGVYPTSITASDVDRDGDMDLVVANQLGDSVSVIRNDGAGIFTSLTERAAGQGPAAVTSVELAPGALPSLLVANRDQGLLHLLTPEGNSRQVTLGVAPLALLTADLDGDGARDVAVAHSDGTVMLLKPDGSGSLAAVTQVRAGTSPSMVISADLNGDGRRDLITSNLGSNDVTVHLHTSPVL